MINQSWKGLFEKRILDRGWSYYLEGNVEDMYRDDDCVYALVCGADDYEVEIYLDGDNVDGMHCDCPYAEEHNACKHMAAVLYALSNEDIPEITDVSIPWREALNNLSTEEMRSLLSELANENVSLQLRLCLMKATGDVDIIDVCGRELGDIAEKYMDDDGFIDYYHAFDFHSELAGYLERKLFDLKSSGTLLDSFLIVCCVYEAAMEQETDDSDGGLSMIMGMAHHYWNEFLEKADDTQQEEMHRWFVSAVENADWLYGTDDVEGFLFEYDWNSKLLDKNLQILDRLIDDCDDSSYHFESLLKWRETTMIKLGASREEVERFWYTYRELAFVRKREIDRNIQKKNYEKAIQLLVESKEKDSYSWQSVKQHSEKLIELYRKTGQEKQYRDELSFQIFSCNQYDLEYVKLYHQVVPETLWPHFVEKLLKSPTMKYLTLDLLAYDKQYQRLLDAIMKNGWIVVLEKYESLLKEWSPEKVRESYAEILDNEMRCASDRKSYRNVVKHLNKLKPYPDGNITAKKLADKWKSQYVRRTAMLDELNKAGY